MLQVGLGQAEGVDTRTIVERAIDDCAGQLAGAPPQAGIVFSGPHLDHGLMLEIINDGFPGIALVGCSTAGNFSSFQGVSDDGLTLPLLASDIIEFGYVLATTLPATPAKTSKGRVWPSGLTPTIGTSQ